MSKHGLTSETLVSLLFGFFLSGSEAPAALFSVLRSQFSVLFCFSSGVQGGSTSAEAAEQREEAACGISEETEVP